MKQFVFWISFWESLILWIIHHFLFPFNLDCPVFGQIYWSLPLCTLFPLLSRTQKRHQTLAVGQNKWKSSAAGDCFLHSRRAEGPAFYPRLIIWSVIKWRSLKNVCSLKKKNPSPAVIECAPRSCSGGVFSEESAHGFSSDLSSSTSPSSTFDSFPYRRGTQVIKRGFD